MLIKDELALRREAKRLKEEVTRANLHSYITNILEASTIFTDDETSPANGAYQLGKELTEEQFAAKIQKLNIPGLMIERHPTKDNVRIIYHVRPGGRVLIVTYYGGILPEFTIMARKKTIVPDLDYFGVNAKKIHRNDLPAGEYKGITEGWVYPEGTVMPGQKAIWEPSRVLWRGWWSVLAALIHEGLTTPFACEREFGQCSRESWKALTGQGGTTPF